MNTCGMTPKVFIPPENKFNSDTLSVLEENGITHMSSIALINRHIPCKIPSFIASLQHLQQESL